jgi:sugar phosphate isomerase/epimerase
MTITLSYCTESIPGEDLSEQIGNARKAGVAVDLVVNPADLENKSKLVETVKSAQCSTIVAYDCHGKNIISDVMERADFLKYMLGLIDLAQAIGCGNILTAIYEKEQANKQVAGELYQTLAALSSGINILIEALDKERTCFCPSVDEMYEFVQGVNARNVRMVIDTNHAHTSENELCRTLEAHVEHIAGIHLRDTNSLPPGKGSLDFNRIGQMLRAGDFSGLVSVECKQFKDYQDFEQNVAYLKQALEL